MSRRRAIATVGDLRQILSNFSDDYLVATNSVGNLTIYPPTGEDGIGYIEMQNIEFWDGRTRPVASWSLFNDY